MEKLKNMTALFNYIFSNDKFKIHYESETDYIKSLGNYVSYKINSQIGSFYIPDRFPCFFAKNKFLRRLLRLNRMNLKFLNNDSLLIVRSGKVFIYDLQIKKIIETLRFPFTRYVHSETIIIDNNEIVIGEYGNSKLKHKIGIFISSDYGITWRKINLFGKGEVKNILSVKWDKFSKVYWVFTGDNEEHSGIFIYNKKWEPIEKIGTKKLTFRSISSVFFENEVVWLTNDPFNNSNVVIYDRKSKEISIGDKFDGPIWYAVPFKNYYLAITAAEKSEKYVYLYFSEDFKKWEIIKKFEKDIYNNKFFLMGLITFTEHPQNFEYQNIYFDAIKMVDGTNCRIV